MSLVTLRRRSDSVHKWRRHNWMVLCLLVATVPVFAQAVAEPQSTDKDEKKPVVNSSEANPNRQKDAGAEIRNGHARLKPFYDVSFHSVPDSSAVNLSDYLVDQRFWQRRPTVVVVTPISPNVLQPDEGHAEALTEALMRQIAADLGVREVHDKVSQTIGFLRKLSKKSKRGEGESEGGTRDTVEQTSAEQAKPDKSAEPTNTITEQQPDPRGLRTVQLILMPDARPVWNGMSLFDRSTVVDRSLSEYLKKVPTKRDRLVQYLEPDQFRFAAFPGKEAGSQMMDSLGLRRPELHFFIVDRNGEVVGDWNKFNFDAKKISATYRALSKDTNTGNE